MADFDQTITRSNVGSIVPTQFADEIIKQLPQTSIVARNALKVTMSSKEYKQPVLASLPEAFFTGDEALAKTTKASWEDLSIVADTLTCMVPVPNTVLDDSKINLWKEITPLVTQAMGKKIDEAAIFNIGKPTAWNAPSLIEGATTAGNILKLTAQKTIPVAVTELAGKIATQGFAINGFVHAPGMDWKLRDCKEFYVMAFLGRGQAKLCELEKLTVGKATITIGVVSKTALEEIAEIRTIVSEVKNTLGKIFK